MSDFIDASPNPEYLIKSIAEQGYSMETALADLIDNSITAGADKIEILTDSEDDIRLFLADNGCGMSGEELSKNMRFPSNSVENDREPEDLGRFGLGLKTASFSQTRHFTVLSREKESDKFEGRTWNVDHLKKTGKWQIKVESQEEIEKILSEYERIKSLKVASQEDFVLKTLIVWNGLYKFSEEFISSEKRIEALHEQLTRSTQDHLGIVFHKFMEKEKPLKILLNNTFVKPFNPFPRKRIRSLGPRQVDFDGDIVRMEGFVLPSVATKESKILPNDWTTEGMGLMDLEGLYIYRGERLIFYGGWNGLIKKSPNLKLARLKIDVGNKNDVKLQLNVSKSKISLPFEYKYAFIRYAVELKENAQREYFNREVREISSRKDDKDQSLFVRESTMRGVKLKINRNSPVFEKISNSLSGESAIAFRILVKSIENTISVLKDGKENVELVSPISDNEINVEELKKIMKTFLDSGYSKETVREMFIRLPGYSETELPDEIIELIK
ncbi:MAG: ATP-binding protein [Deltaproteobacteria bacterium]|nr:MAG: ATP-binding protein [Deltaproteobacteria bacterium]